MTIEDVIEKHFETRTKFFHSSDAHKNIEGDLILDNCSGSGTLAIECIRNNRNWIMIEQKEEYYNLSLKRVEDFLNSFSHETSNEDEK